MEHSLWVIGDNKIVALNEIRNVTPAKEGSTIFFKDGSKEAISEEETNNLVKAIMETQKENKSQHTVKKLNHNRNDRQRDWS